MMNNNINPSQLSPLTLAYIGDSVYELYIRNRVLSEHPTMAAHKLHLHTINYVKAAAQSRSIGAIENNLTEDELTIYKRGRNAKSYTSPKNANIMDYRRATGFEALIGYVYLTGDRDRLCELMDKAFENALETVN